jgi:hypothetical protein
MKHVIFALLVVCAVAPRLAARSTADVVGVVHWGGLYHFSATQDFLNEGADRIRQLGSRVIKVTVGQHPSGDYPFNSPNWPESPTSLTQVVQTSYFQTLLQKDFTTFVLLAAPSCGEFSDGFTTAEYSCESTQLHDLAYYLLQNYANTGKTFVLQNWEGDNKLNGTYNDTSFTGMKRYLTARQEGVNLARSELSYVTGVTVLNAAEVNLVWEAAQGFPRATNMVLPGLRTAPYLPPDLYSYSVWDFDTQTLAPSQLIADLNYLQSQTGATRDQIYLGEYGITDHIDDATDKEQIAKLTQAALAWGVRYALYWQVFSNETPTQTTWWLVRPDGSLPPVWYYFQDLMTSSMYRVTLQNISSWRYLNSQSGNVTADATSTSDATTFLLFDLNGGSFLRDDRVGVVTSSGNYITAENNGGDVVDATRWFRGPWEEFVLEDDFPTDGVIADNDTVVFTAGSGQDVKGYSPTDPVYPSAVRADGVRPSPSFIPYEVLWQMRILQ